jgi:hypothetical protein
MKISFLCTTKKVVWSGIAVAMLSTMAWGADVQVRKYNSEDAVVPGGEAKFRKIENANGFSQNERLVGEPAPYVATSPLAIGFAPKFEFPPESWDVTGLRLNLLVGNHRAVYALDLGAIGNFADYKMDGIGIAGIFNSIGESDGAIQIAGIVNFAAFNFSGCQISGICSLTEGTLTGVQIGVGNYAGILSGVQLGAFNSAEQGSGVQIGVVNYADKLEGVQLGLVNVIQSSTVRFMPVLNMAF